MAENQDPNKKAQDTKKSLKEIADVTKVIEEGFRSIVNELNDMIDEIKQGSKALNSYNDTVNDIEKSIKRLSKADETLIENASKLRSGNLDSKKVLEQINKITTTRTVLQSRINSLQEEAKKNNIDQEQAQAKINELTKQLENYSTSVTDQYKKQYEEAKKIEEKIGNTGKWLQALTKIPIVGQFIDANKALEEYKYQLGQGASKTQALGAALKVVGKSIIDNMLNPVTLVAGAFKLLTEIDESTGKLAKGMNLSYNDALKLKKELKEVGENSKNAFLNSESLGQSLVAINKTLGSSAKINTEDLKTFTALREQAGYTNEELTGIYRFTLATGGNLKNNVKTFEGTVKALNAQNKLSINEKQLLQDISKVSDAIKLSVGGTTEKIAEAAYKAKQFGINLEQADKISESLLNFESSIENELSAELLTGKDLNLEKARLLALNGDIAGASAEVLKQVKGSAEFTKMNRIQQEALAKAVGMSREELAKSLIEREALTKLGGQDVEIDGKKVSLQEYYNKLRADGMSQEEIIAKLGDKSLADQLASTSNAEKWQAFIAKLKDQFLPIAEKILPKIGKLIEWISNNTGFIKGMFIAIGTAIAAIKLGGFISQLRTAAAVSRVLAASSAGTASASTFGAAAIPIAAGIATILAALAAGYLLGDDVYSEGGYGERTLLTPKGSIALNNEDTVIAGTNLFPSKKGDDVVSSPKGSVKATESNTSQNININPGEVVLNIDGMAFAKATYKYIVEEMRKGEVKVQ